MSVGRIIRHKSEKFVTISNEIMREKEVSLTAKGLYALVMSLPDNWDFTLKGICAISKENYTAINNAHKVSDYGCSPRLCIGQYPLLPP